MKGKGHYPGDNINKLKREEKYGFTARYNFQRGWGGGLVLEGGLGLNTKAKTAFTGA